MNQELLKLRDIFREWYGALSEDEIVSNAPLIKLIEVIEKGFRALGGEFS